MKLSGQIIKDKGVNDMIIRKSDRKSDYRKVFNENLENKVVNSYREFMNLSDDDVITEEMLDDFSVSTIAVRNNVPVERVRKMLIGKH